MEGTEEEGRGKMAGQTVLSFFYDEQHFSGNSTAFHGEQGCVAELAHAAINLGEKAVTVKMKERVCE